MLEKREIISLSQFGESTMSTKRIQRLFWRWLNTALLSLLVMISAILILGLFLLIFQVRSFEIGDSNIWLLRWQNPTGVPFSMTWNMLPLLLLAATIGLIRVLLPTQPSVN
jgi:hypothetical protein